MEGPAIVTLANVRGSSLVPNIADAVREDIGGFQDRGRAAEAQSALTENLRIALGGAQTNAAPSKGLGVLGQLAPEIAQAASAIIGNRDPQAAEAFRGEAKQGLALSKTIMNAPSFSAKQKLLADEVGKIAGQGGDVSRLVNLSNLNEDQLDLELQKMQLVGKGMLGAVPAVKSGDALNVLSTPARREAFARVAATNPRVANTILASRDRGLSRTAASQRAAVTAQAAANKPLTEIGRRRRDLERGFITEEDFAQASSGGGDFSKAPGLVVRQPDGTFAQEIPVLNKETGTFRNAIVPISGQPVSRLGETGTELSERLVGQAGATTQVKAEEKRASTQIDEGFSAADQLPVLNRSLELLKTVETGGFDAANLRAKQIFGIEGADEGELSANLGKAVVSQLRQTFGSQFTEREGAQLRRIEAGFGKSVASNVRLLNATKRLATRVANRGIRAAERNNDFDTADEIRSAMEFSLTPESEGSLAVGESTTKNGVTVRRTR